MYSTLYMNGKFKERLHDDFNDIDLTNAEQYTDYGVFKTCVYGDDSFLIYNSCFFDNKMDELAFRIRMYKEREYSPERTHESIENKLRSTVEEDIKLLTYGVNVCNDICDTAERVINRLQDEEKILFIEVSRILKIHEDRSAE